jgi:phosphoribosylformylglycinamidine cyclo-ligase
MSNSKTPLSYRDAGVDIEAGDSLVERIKPLVRRTKRPEVMGGLGGFGALVRVPLDRYRKPVMVSGTDGVGTKLRLAIDSHRHDTIGIDLVAMCVNDIVVQGAEPIYFLDYYATGKLDIAVAEKVIAGIVEGCEQAGCALVGGETAEMPGMYHAGDYDLAGFAVGLVEEDGIIDGRHTAAGDVILGLASSGPHSNGYSLIRALLARENAHAETLINGQSLLDALMQPTRIYVKSLLKLVQQGLPVKGFAHITGGGITDNLPRIFPEQLGARVDPRQWQRPWVFDWLAKASALDSHSLHQTFNCGIGMTVTVAPQHANEVAQLLSDCGETVYTIGEMIPGIDGVELVA